MPPPQGDPDATLRGLVFDSWFDQYRGVVILVHVVDGELKPGMKVRLMASGGSYLVENVGVFTPKPMPVEQLAAGEVGFVVAGIKKVSDVAIGDTLTDDRKPAAGAAPRLQGDQADGVRRALPGGRRPVRRAAGRAGEAAPERRVVLLRAGDLDRARASASAAGSWACCTWRSSRSAWSASSRLNLLVTAPSVRYRVHKTNGEMLEIDSPARLPDPGSIEFMEEPIITATILTGDEFVGPILKLCQEKRGIQKGLHYITTTRVMIEYELPLNEILLDFYDRLKSASKGYASLDYQFTGHWTSPLVKLDVLVNGEPVDALSLILHKDSSFTRGKSLVEKMRKLIPRQMFEVAIQAAIGSRVIARETVKPLRKNVIAKCYGGDISRKRKLLEKQKEGKKRMKRVGAGGHPAGSLPGRVAGGRVRRSAGLRTSLWVVAAALAVISNPEVPHWWPAFRLTLRCRCGGVLGGADDQSTYPGGGVGRCP